MDGNLFIAFFFLICGLFVYMGVVRLKEAKELDSAERKQKIVASHYLIAAGLVFPIGVLLTWILHSSIFLGSGLILFIVFEIRAGQHIS